MTPEMQAAVILQYQQWLADAQLGLAVMTTQRDALATERDALLAARPAGDE